MINDSVSVRSTTGQRRPIYFQYEMGTSESVKSLIDNLLNDWSKIVYLYHLVHDFSEQFKSGEYSICYKNNSRSNGIIVDICFFRNELAKFRYYQIVFLHESVNWLWPE